jgi:hypothetical protein
MSLLAATYGAIAGATRHAYAGVVMDTEPVAWWPLDANLVDRIGARNGAIGAGSEVHAAALPRDSGGSFQCAGINWITVPHDAALKPAVGSLMAWCRPATVHSGIVMAANALGINPADFALRVYASGTISCFFQQSGVTQVSETASPYYEAGQIVQAIVTFDTNGFILYLDGNKIASNAMHTAGFTANMLDWRFGEQHDTSTIFNGLIDEIAIWNRVLTRNEIYLLAQTEPD